MMTMAPRSLEMKVRRRQCKKKKQQKENTYIKDIKDIKEPDSALSLRSIQVPIKEKQNSGGDGCFLWMLTCKVKYYVFCLEMMESYLLL